MYQAIGIYHCQQAVWLLKWTYPSSETVAPYMSEMFSNGKKATDNQSISRTDPLNFHKFFFKLDQIRVL